MAKWMDWRYPLRGFDQHVDSLREESLTLGNGNRDSTSSPHMAQETNKFTHFLGLPRDPDSLSLSLSLSSSPVILGLDQLSHSGARSSLFLFGHHYLDNDDFLTRQDRDTCSSRSVAATFGKDQTFEHLDNLHSPIGMLLVIFNGTRHTIVDLPSHADSTLLVFTLSCLPPSHSHSLLRVFLLIQRALYAISERGFEIEVIGVGVGGSGMVNESELNINCIFR
jgi:hypothetical protein